METMQTVYEFESSLSGLQRGLNKLREVRVVFESFGELSKEVLKFEEKKST